MSMAPAPRLRAVKPFPPPLTEAAETTMRPAAAPASTAIPSPRSPRTNPFAEIRVAPPPRLSARMPRFPPVTAAADTVRSVPDGAPWAWIPSCPAAALDSIGMLSERMPCGSASAPPATGPVADTEMAPVPRFCASIPCPRAVTAATLTVRLEPRVPLRAKTP